MDNQTPGNNAHTITETGAISSNGAGVAPPQTQQTHILPNPNPAPIMPMGFTRREVWIDLESEQYPGHQFKIWANYPKKIELDLTSRDEPRVADALGKIVLEHNGWRDFEGNVYPQPNIFKEELVEDEDGSKKTVRRYPFWDEIPDEVAQLIIIKIHIETQKLPNSVAESYRLSRLSQLSRTRKG